MKHTAPVSQTVKHYYTSLMPHADLFPCNPIGYHLSGPSQNVMPHAVFSREFLQNPHPGWAVQFTKFEKGVLQGGVLVKHLDTRRVWKLTGLTYVNDLGQTMYTAEWPD